MPKFEIGTKAFLINSTAHNSLLAKLDDKTNKMTVCPAKTQISLGIRPV